MEIIKLNKSCLDCGLSLTSINAVKRSAFEFRNKCKPCRNKRERFNIKCRGCNKKGVRVFHSRFCSDLCSFMSKIEKTDSCWIWESPIGKDGYGIFAVGIDDKSQRKTLSAHRFSFKYLNYNFDNNLCVLHKCDVRNCVNPDHLFLGTHDDNMKDMVAKGRQRTRYSMI